jgi:mycofactocin glycosyltransferase
VGRPNVDVIVPFRGPGPALRELGERLSGLRLGPGDTLTIVDNTPRREPLALEGAGPTVVHAADVAAPGYARNRGVERGSAEWLLFLDADVIASPDLLDRYFDLEPAEDTGLIAGGVIDEPVPPDGPPAARYAYIRRFMSQDDTLRFGDWGFPKTANAACRRVAFEAIGGFRENIRAAEDADLTYRLKAAGWKLERRENAVAVHRSRQTLGRFATQKLCHGAGGAWLNREYPGAAPARRRLGLTWWAMRHAARNLVAAARTRDRDLAVSAVLDPLELLAHEFGRSLPNERPLTARTLFRHLRHLREPRGVERLRDAGPPRAAG